jgi:FtsZ-interacting cell division protein ZipA
VATWLWVLIAIAVVVLIVVGLVVAARQRSTRLRTQFGPEYERTIQDRDGRRAAESELRNRQKQREQLTIHPLPEPARASYAEQWRDVQERFVDQPASAVLEADELVRRVMNDEGYPVDDFNQQADLVSVDHPRVVENYRTAHRVYERTQAQQASTEDMRSALLSYRSLFDELLHVGEQSDDRSPLPNTTARHRMDDSDLPEAGAR